MKKIVSLVLALVLTLALTACGGGESGQSAAYSPDQVQAMADAGAFSETLEELDGDTAFALYRLADYGLSREDLTDCAVLRSSGATCEEGAVLVFAGEDQADQGSKALDSYVQNQITSNRDYRHAEIPKLEAAELSCRGNTVLLVVASDLETALGALEG